MMNSKFLSDMAQATALTRAGKLGEATALLQRSLHAQPNPPSAAPAMAEDGVIDGVFTVLGEPAPPPAPSRATLKPRKPLGATLRDISRGGMPEAGLRRAAPTANTATFTLHHHRSAAGARDYMVFLPDPMPQTPCPVVVMLHGCTQSPQDFAQGTRMNKHAQAQGVIVIYPAQPTGANMNKCWNWFRPEDQQRESGELAVIAGITRDVLALQNADPTRVYVAGLSAGGATAALLGQTYPDVFAAVGVHSGLAAGAASDVPQAFAAMRSGANGAATGAGIATIVFHGTADTTVHLTNAQCVADQAQRGLAGKRAMTKAASANGRTYEKSTLSDAGGKTVGEVWLIKGAGHAWSGGSAGGSHTDPSGPDASAEMLRFFAQHRLG